MPRRSSIRWTRSSLPARPAGLWVLLLIALLAVPRPMPATAEERNVHGIKTVLPPDSTQQTAKQLGWVRAMVGSGGHVSQPFSPVGQASPTASDQAIAFVNQAYALGLDPIISLEGEFANGTACGPRGLEGWQPPVPDASNAPRPSYRAEAAGFARFVAGLPKADGRTLYIQVWNEPNLDYMWGGAADPARYARFFVDVSKAIRELGDPRVKVLNAALAPEGDVDNLTFIERAIAADPDYLRAFDVWASHPYPHNQPPANNLHDGTALAGSRYTIDAYLLELDVLRRYGLDTSKLQVVLTETGYELKDNWYPEYPVVNEENRADYIRQAFDQYWSRWPEVLAVTPFELADTHGSWRQYDWIWSSSGVDAQGLPTQPHLQYARMLPNVGIVRGRVTDDRGKPLRGATVTTDTNGHRAVTLGDGSFILLAYPGTYQLTASKSGYLSVGGSTVAVTNDGAAAADFALALKARAPKAPRNANEESSDLSEWTPWGEADGVQQDEWYADVKPRDGHFFLGTASNCAEKDGGFLQSVEATPGAPLDVSAWTLTYKEGSAPMGNRLGVDPTGGTDPSDESVVWTEWIRTGGAWKQVRLNLTPQSDRITIFLQHAQNSDNRWNINAFDRIEVNAVGAPPD